MRLYEGFVELLKIQKLRRIVSYTGFYCFVAGLSYAYTNNTTRAGYSRGDQFYASYPAGTELLVDTTKLYKAALGNCFETEEWGPIEFSIMAKHFNRQGNSAYEYHSACGLLLPHGPGFNSSGPPTCNTWHTSSPWDNLMEAAKRR
ncbi:hypothetical protein TIFTF001_007981 [Ficus carica]|uniref:Uncharacterized protein n=1 Tax=Ficus carica TaxID=3494 RepID=A0AA87ZU33_FICCA|nr:hypothetical protein TIFTF001_007981 [Ficus carica]